VGVAVGVGVGVAVGVGVGVAVGVGVGVAVGVGVGVAVGIGVGVAVGVGVGVGVGDGPPGCSSKAPTSVPSAALPTAESSDVRAPPRWSLVSAPPTPAAVPLSIAGLSG